MLDKELLKKTCKKLVKSKNYRSSDEYMTIAANLKYSAYENAIDEFDFYSEGYISDYHTHEVYKDIGDLETVFSSMFNLYIEHYKYAKLREKRKTRILAERNSGPQNYYTTLLNMEEKYEEARDNYSYLLVLKALTIRDRQAMAKLKKGSKELLGSTQVKEDEDAYGNVAHNLLSSNFPVEKAEKYRSYLAINVKDIGYREAIKKFKCYAHGKDKSTKNVDDAHKAFFDAFVKYYNACHNLSKAEEVRNKKEEHEDASVDNETIYTLKAEKNRFGYEYNKEKEAYAAALVADAVKKAYDEALTLDVNQKKPNYLPQAMVQ